MLLFTDVYSVEPDVMCLKVLINSTHNCGGTTVDITTIHKML